MDDRTTTTRAKATSAWPPAYLDAGGLAHELQVSSRQVRRMLSAGKLPAADVNLTGSLKGRRWRRDRLLAWLESQGPVIRGGANAPASNGIGARQ